MEREINRNSQDELTNRPCLDKNKAIGLVKEVCRSRNISEEATSEIVGALEASMIGWFSRSAAACLFVYKLVDGNLFVLAEKRGIGAADFQHCWCCPCGYLEYGETLEECIASEAMEECGFKVEQDKLCIIGINSSPNANKQNVSIRFGYLADVDDEFDLSRRSGGEKDEVEDVKWVQIGHIEAKGNKSSHDMLILTREHISQIQWCFDHDKIIFEGATQLFSEKFCVFQK